MSTPSPPRAETCDHSPVTAAKVHTTKYYFVGTPKAGTSGRQGTGAFTPRDRGVRRGDIVEFRPDHPDLELDLDRHQGPARHRAADLVGQLPLLHRRRRPRSAPPAGA